MDDEERNNFMASSSKSEQDTTSTISHKEDNEKSIPKNAFQIVEKFSQVGADKIIGAIKHELETLKGVKLTVIARHLATKFMMVDEMAIYEDLAEYCSAKKESKEDAIMKDVYEIIKANDNEEARRTRAKTDMRKLRIENDYSNVSDFINNVRKLDSAYRNNSTEQNIKFLAASFSNAQEAKEFVRENQKDMIKMTSMGALCQRLIEFAENRIRLAEFTENNDRSYNNNRNNKHNSGKHRSPNPETLSKDDARHVITREKAKHRKDGCYACGSLEHRKADCPHRKGSDTKGGSSKDSK